MEFKTVYELLEDPERWTQRASARDENDLTCIVTDKRAAKFCLIGAISKVYPKDEERIKMLVRLENIIGQSAVHFNDSSTHAEVLEVVKKAGI